MMRTMDWTTDPSTEEADWCKLWTAKMSHGSVCCSDWLILVLEPVNPSTEEADWSKSRPQKCHMNRSDSLIGLFLVWNLYCKWRQGDAAVSTLNKSDHSVPNYTRTN